MKADRWRESYDLDRAEEREWYQLWLAEFERAEQDGALDDNEEDYGEEGEP